MGTNKNFLKCIKSKVCDPKQWLFLLLSWETFSAEKLLIWTGGSKTGNCSYVPNWDFINGCIATLFFLLWSLETSFANKKVTNETIDMLTNEETDNYVTSLKMTLITDFNNPTQIFEHKTLMKEQKWL